MGSRQQGARELWDCKDGKEVYDRFSIVVWISCPITKGMLY